MQFFFYLHDTVSNIKRTLYVNSYRGGEGRQKIYQHGTNLIEADLYLKLSLYSILYHSMVLLKFVAIVSEGVLKNVPT